MTDAAVEGPPIRVTGMSSRAKKIKRPLPAPLVHFFRHPFKWVVIKVELLIAAITLAHIGMFIVVALYYILTQQIGPVNHFWHTAVSNSDLRHSIRDVGEGVLGGIAAQAIVWNHFTKAHMKAGRLFEQLHDRWHIPEIPASILASIIFGAAGFFTLYFILHALHTSSPHHSVIGSFWNRSLNGIWKSDWDKKAMGYAAADVVAVTGQAQAHRYPSNHQRAHDPAVAGSCAAHRD